MVDMLKVSAPLQDIQSDYTSFNLVLDATHNQLQMRLAELKFDKRWNVLQCKEQLMKRFGSAICDQTLELHNSAGNKICDLADDTKTLESYGVVSG